MQVSYQYDFAANCNKKEQISLQILLMTESTGITLKILLLALKPTWHLVPRGRNNLQLCVTD